MPILTHPEYPGDRLNSMWEKKKNSTVNNENGMQCLADLKLGDVGILSGLGYYSAPIFVLK